MCIVNTFDFAFFAIVKTTNIKMQVSASSAIIFILILRRRIHQLCNLQLFRQTATALFIIVVIENEKTIGNGNRRRN